MKNNTEINELNIRVVRLCDEFAQFYEQCAFLCDSFAAISAQQEYIEPKISGGISFYTRWIKTRLVEIQSELQKIHAQLNKP